MIKLKDILYEGYGGHTVKIHIRSLDRNKSDQYPAFLVKLAGNYQDEPIIQFIPKSSKDLDKIKELGDDDASIKEAVLKSLKAFAEKKTKQQFFMYNQYPGAGYGLIMNLEGIVSKIK